MFRITARTVLELGSELISSDIIAFYELIKNGFDAATRNGVEVRFDIALPKNEALRLRHQIERGGDLDAHKAMIEQSLLTSASQVARDGFKAMIAAAQSSPELLSALDEAQARFNTIVVSDTGSGMSMQGLYDNFLVIGTASRKRDVDQALARGAATSPYLGEKGLGRLSAMRLGERLRVETARAEDAQINLLEINWRDFDDAESMLDQIKVDPKTGGSKPSPTWSGTSIIISDLSEHWTGQRVQEMAEEEFARLTDPFDDAGSRPRIALFWNGVRQAVPVMKQALLDACHAKMTGEYKIVDGEPQLTCTLDVIDLGFKHPAEQQIVTMTLPDLQGVIIGKDSNIEDGALVSVGPFSFEAYWYNRRRLTELDSIGDRKLVRELQERWSGIMLFRDHFRVFPYGEEEDDWLALDRKALGRKGYALNKTQFLGRVAISRAGNPKLLDQTNREGLRETPEQHVFLEVLRHGVQDLLGAFMKRVERQYKSPKIDLSGAEDHVKELEDRAKNAIQRIRRMVGPENGEAVDQVNEVLHEFSDFAERARARIAQVEDESKQMIDMAGVGLMVEVVAHELARASENALKALEQLKSGDIPPNLRAYFNTLQAEMKSVSKRVRTLDPMSVSGRQRKETFLLDAVLRDTIEAHEAQFKRHRVIIDADLGKRPLRIKAVKGMIVQIIENLISNSIYWMDLRAKRELRYQPKITIRLHGNPPTLLFEDNGPGIAPANREQIFTLFFSLKENTKRRGLGLFIARDAAEHHNGSLALDDEIDPETGRLHRFVLELPPEAQV